jgi:antitoxin (DNA-binding transcriptional repressor) of toxin-antitoxin stability system
MEQPIAIASLRQRPSECIARAAAGETFVVLNRGRPVAILRPRSGHERYEPLSATMLWRHIHEALAQARRTSVLITWHGNAMAVLGPLPPDWQWEGSES